MIVIKDFFKGNVFKGFPQQSPKFQTFKEPRNSKDSIPLAHRGR